MIGSRVLGGNDALGFLLLSEFLFTEGNFSGRDFFLLFDCFLEDDKISSLEGDEEEVGGGGAGFKRYEKGE